MKHLFTLTLVLLFTQFGKSQTIDPGLKDCLQGNYVFTDENNNTFALYLKPTMALEFVGHIYGAPFGEDESRHIGEFVTYGGKWGADENTVNIITGTFKNADKYKNDKKAPEYYAWHFQNAGYKGTYDLVKGTITIMGKTYVRSEGPCSQTRLKEHEANREGQSEVAEPVKPSPALVYTGRESDLDKLKDQYIETFSESGQYNAYVAGENIKRLGVSMAKDFSDNLKSIGKLIETTDPAALQKDYMDKMRNIESLEATFNAESNSYFFQSGQQLGGSITNKDYESAMFQAGGLLNAHLERKEAEKELEKQKAELTAAKNKKMLELYYKAESFNDLNKGNYLKLAANSADPETEKYYLGLVENLDCYKKSMWNGLRKENPNWLDNNCPVPTYNQSNLQQNNLVSEDVRLSKLAEKKYTYFKATGYNAYRDAAIAFASAAITQKPKSQYFSQIGEYYTNYSNVLALGNFMAAKEFGGLNTEHQKIVDSLTPIVQGEIKEAITEHNLDYLNSFLKVGLDDVIKVENKGLLEYSIHLDEADAMQSILNSRVASLSDKQKTELIQNSLFLMTINNSHACVHRFIEIGLPIDFKINKKHPIDLANELLSEDVFQILMVNCNEGSFYENKYKNSAIHALISINQKPELAKEILAALDQEKELARVVSRMVEQFNEKPNYVRGVGESPTAKAYLKSSEDISNNVKLKFCKELKTPYTISVAHLYLQKEIIEFDHIPTLLELGMDKPMVYFLHNRNAFKNTKNNNGLVEPYYDKITFELNENLAYIAWRTRNPIVFNQLDEQFNLLNQNCSNGMTLFENMISSPSFTNLSEFYMYTDYQRMNSKSIGSDKDYLNYMYSKEVDTSMYRQIIGNLYQKYEQHYTTNIIQEYVDELVFLTQYENDRKLFYSEDFNFNLKLKNEWPIFYYINQIEKRLEQREVINYLVFQFELYEILKYYKISSDQKDLKNGGGSIIHFYLNEIVKNTNTYLPDPNFIKSLNVNLNLRNSNNQTAHEYAKENKKEFDKKYTMQTFLDSNKSDIRQPYYELMWIYFDNPNESLRKTFKNDSNLFNERQWVEIVLSK